MSGHIVPVRFYVGIFLTLMVLTALTVGVSYVNLGALNVAVALVIAISKAALVLLFFMHLRYSPKLSQITGISGFVFFLILVVLTASDYMTRGILGPGK